VIKNRLLGCSVRIPCPHNRVRTAGGKRRRHAEAGKSWKLTARCAFGNLDGRKSTRACIYRAPLDMQTLVWTRGPNFPLSRLESRLMCPECGSRRVSVLFDVPKVPVAAWAKRATER
jgi:hypothetical protein